MIPTGVRSQPASGCLHPQPGRSWLQPQQPTVAAVTTQQTAITGRVYRATCPLEGWDTLAGGLGPLYLPPLHMHHFVVLETVPGDDGGGSPGSGRTACTPLVAAYDFLPSDPTSPVTAGLLLSGGSVPGLARTRTLRGLPQQRCRLVGCTTLSDPHAAAAAFQRQYDRHLQLLRDDCTHHVDRLISHLLQQRQAVVVPAAAAATNA